jgi:hypothetical protein
VKYREEQNKGKSKGKEDIRGKRKNGEKDNNGKQRKQISKE